MLTTISATLVVGLLAFPVLAQSTEDQSLQPAQRWNDFLARAETYARVRTPSDFGLSFHREQLDHVRKEASRSRDAAQERLLELEQVIALLGPAPDASAAPEPNGTAKRRQSYENELAHMRTTLADAELALARVKALESDLAAAARRSLLDSVLVQLPFPLSPESLWTAAHDALEILRARARAFESWYRELSEDGAGRRGIWWQLQILFAFAVALVVGWFARRWILRRFGRDPTIEVPSYTRTVVAAVADALARGVIPALMIAGLMAFFARPGALVTGPAELTLLAFLGAILFVVLVVAITRAVLAPELPHWRTIEVAPENAQRITRIIVLIAAVYATDIFFRIVSKEFVVSQELLSVGLTLTVTLQAGAILALSRRNALGSAHNRRCRRARIGGQNCKGPVLALRQEHPDHRGNW